MRKQLLRFSIAGIACCTVGLLGLAGGSDAGENLTAEHSETSAQRKKEMDIVNHSKGELSNRRRIEAARRGDEIERKKISAQLKDNNPARQLEAIEMAKSVGGPDMIVGLGNLLSDTTGYRSIDTGRGDERRPQGDLVLEPPRFIAAKALAELIDNPPVPPIGRDKKFYTQQDVLIWRNWWRENKAKFEAP